MTPDTLASGPREVPGRARRGWALLVCAAVVVGALAAWHQSSAQHAATAPRVVVRADGYGFDEFRVRVGNPGERPVTVTTATVRFPHTAASAAGGTIGAHADVVLRFPFDPGAECAALLTGRGRIVLHVRQGGGSGTSIDVPLPRYPVSRAGSAWEVALGGFRCRAGLR